jgi:hypothetical protein
MATTIALKNSVTTTNTPSSLAQGEVAINVTDKKVWVGNAATTPILLVNGGSDGVFTSVTDSGLTNTRLTYAGAGGLLKDSANITTDGTTITAAFSGAHNGTVGATTPAAGTFTSISGPHNGTVGATTPATGSFTTLTASSTLSFPSQSIPFTSLPAGSVLQVVSASYSTPTSTSSSTLTDTGVTATITPKFSTSKILIMVTQNGIAKAPTAVSNCTNVSIIRNSTNIINFSVFTGYTNSATDNITGSSSMTYLDSPATTSATTYKTQFASAFAGGAVYVQNNNAVSGITLMEIAA